MKTALRFTREPLSLKVGKTITALMITLTIMILVLAILFLTMMSSGSQKGYELKQLQLQNRELQSENEKLKTALTETLSFEKLETAPKVKEMQKPQQKIFINK